MIPAFDKIRVIETGPKPASWNMALDEILLNKLGDTPILRIYAWNPSAVSIGYFQSIQDEVNVENCKQNRIDIVRRMTGGGAVFHESEVTYSFLTKRFPKSIIESYRWICDGVISGINKLGYQAKFSPLNDITINGKKVSGNAQTRKKDSLLQHGTILLDADIERMFSVLKIAPEKIKDKMIDDVRQRITVLSKSFEEAALALEKGFGEKFQAKLTYDPLTFAEESEAEKLAKEKYESVKWNWKK